MEPITREEQFMAAAAQGKTDLTPITRQENFLRKIAEAVGGGGSGGMGGADWNAAEGEPGHVLNRTHFVESTPSITYEWDGDLTGKEFIVWDESNGSVKGLVKLSDNYLTMEQLDGAALTVKTPEGDETLTVSTEMMMDISGWMGVPGVAVADYVLSLSDSATNGTEQITRGLWVLYSTATDGVFYAKSIKTMAKETIHKLDKKYLPDDIGGNSDIVVVKITTTDGENYVADMSSTEIAAEMQSGKMVFAIIDNGAITQAAQCRVADASNAIFSAVTALDDTLSSLMVGVHADKSAAVRNDTYTLTPAT